MCLTLPARVIALNSGVVEVEVRGGTRMLAATDLCPEASLGQFVLVDRGQVLRIIDAAEADAIYAIYDEIGEMLDAVDDAEPSAATNPVEYAGAVRSENAE